MLREARLRDRKNKEGGTYFLHRALNACDYIRDGNKDAFVVKQALQDHVIPAEVLDYTTADWGRWATHEMGDDEWPDRFILYTREERPLSFFDQ